MFKFLRKNKPAVDSSAPLAPAKTASEPGATEDFEPIIAEEQVPVEQVAGEPGTVEHVVVDSVTVEPVVVEKFDQKLNKSRSQLGGRLKSMFRLHRKLDDDLLEDLETLLLTADVGVQVSLSIIEQLTTSIKRRELDDADAVLRSLRQQLNEILAPCQQPFEIDLECKPFVILMIGVNGAGKTTTIGKLAHRLRGAGLKVMLAAGDTYRAAAVEQLKAWGERNQVPVVAQASGADSASVVYDALAAARARGVDVLIADTAGRLHTQSNLMDELRKIKRVLAKLDPSAPHEVMLVLDGGAGQNAINQAEQFHQAVKVSGITITKLDGTAKGGMVFALAKKLGIPIRFIGVGENAADLHDFDSAAFVNALLPDHLAGS